MISSHMNCYDFQLNCARSDQCFVSHQWLRVCSFRCVICVVCGVPLYLRYCTGSSTWRVMRNDSVRWCDASATAENNTKGKSRAVPCCKCVGTNRSRFRTLFVKFKHFTSTHGNLHKLSKLLRIETIVCMTSNLYTHYYSHRCLGLTQRSFFSSNASTVSHMTRDKHCSRHSNMAKKEK